MLLTFLGWMLQLCLTSNAPIRMVSTPCTKVGPPGGCAGTGNESSPETHTGRHVLAVGCPNPVGPAAAAAVAIAVPVAAGFTLWTLLHHHQAASHRSKVQMGYAAAPWAILIGNLRTEAAVRPANGLFWSVPSRTGAPPDPSAVFLDVPPSNEGNATESPSILLLSPPPQSSPHRLSHQGLADGSLSGLVGGGSSLANPLSRPRPPPRLRLPSRQPTGWSAPHLGPHPGSTPAPPAGSGSKRSSSLWPQVVSQAVVVPVPAFGGPLLACTACLVPARIRHESAVRPASSPSSLLLLLDCATQLLTTFTSHPPPVLPVLFLYPLYRPVVAVEAWLDSTPGVLAHLAHALWLNWTDALPPPPLCPWWDSNANFSAV
eukprot:jgi/Botrbrau1/15227/Bobra.0149s0082.1